MSIINKLGRALLSMDPGPTRPGRSRFPTTAKRNYDAGRVDRLVGDWMVTNKTADVMLRRELPRIRARSRELCRNNDYGRRFLQLLAQNVIGPHAEGIRYQAKTLGNNGGLDLADNRALEDAWRDWGRLGVCTLDGRMTWRDAQVLILKSIAQDGEIMIRKIRGRTAQNKYNYAIQLIEADHLDEEYCRDLGNDRRIEMSVEFNAANRPVAYHLLRRHPGSEVYAFGGRKYERVDARDVIHPFQFDRITQARGVPWMFAAMQRLHMLGGYEEAELIAARIAASQMGMITTETGDDPVGDGEDAAGNLEFDAEPGVFRQLPAGTDFKMFDPKHPVDAFPAFCKAMLRGVAAGVGISYNSLAQDLENVNYSSLRHGALDERDAYRSIQTWIIGNVIDPIFVPWLEMGLLSNAIGNLPASRLDKFQRREWQPRGWQWVDPLKEVKANKEAVEAGFRSPGDVIADQGKDLADTFAALEAEGVLAALHNLNFSQTEGGQDGNPQDDDDD